MGHKNNGFETRGHPVTGIEAKSVERKFRIEPYLDRQLSYACRALGISRSEAIRQGVVLFLREAANLSKDYVDNERRKP